MFLKFFGYEYVVSLYAYFKVAMEKKTNKDEIDEESFVATCRLYENESYVDVVDNQLMEVTQGKHFTIADVGLDLRIKVVAHDYEGAYAEAESIAKGIRLPVGVSFYDCEAYDYETYREKVVGEW